MFRLLKVGVGIGLKAIRLIVRSKSMRKSIYKILAQYARTLLFLSELQESRSIKQERSLFE